MTMRSRTCFKNLEPCPFASEEKEKTAFVYMPFKKELQDLYESGIKKTLEDLGWTCHRSDERFDTPEIICTICKNTQESSLIIADLTGRNPNVFLEVGLAFGLEKHVVLLSQNLGDIPFDARTFRVFIYNPLELSDLKRKIQVLVENLKPEPKMAEVSVFESRCAQKKKIKAEPTEPLIEIFIGSTKDTIEWLPTSQENLELVRAAPYTLEVESITPRRNRFEFTSRSVDISGSIDSDGFFHAIIPFRNETGAERYYLNWIVYDIVEVFLFIVRVIKKKRVETGQTLRLDLHGIKGLALSLSADRFFIRDYKYSFSKEIESITYEKAFDPRQGWEYFFHLICKIYEDICIDLGMIGMSKDTIKQNVRHIILEMNSIRTTYQSAGLQALSLEEFFGDTKS